MSSAGDEGSRRAAAAAGGGGGSGSGAEGPPVIIYASRTHSQLAQVIRELKNTTYRPRMAVLGSRWGGATSSPGLESAQFQKVQPNEEKRML